MKVKYRMIIEREDEVECFQEASSMIHVLMGEAKKSGWTIESYFVHELIEDPRWTGRSLPIRI